MSKLEAKIVGGVIKYRLPNIPEAFILMGKLGIGEPAAVKEGQNYEFILVGKCIEEMEMLCELPSGKTWADVIGNTRNANSIALIASDVIRALMFDDKKK